MLKNASPRTWRARPAAAPLAPRRRAGRPPRRVGSSVGSETDPGRRQELGCFTEPGRFLPVLRQELGRFTEPGRFLPVLRQELGCFTEPGWFLPGLRQELGCFTEPGRSLPVGWRVPTWIPDLSGLRCRWSRVPRVPRPCGPAGPPGTSLVRCSSWTSTGRSTRRGPEHPVVRPASSSQVSCGIDQRPSHVVSSPPGWGTRSDHVHSREPPASGLCILHSPRR